MKKVFIDGSAGTTGLRIINRIKNRQDLSLNILSDDKRKDIDARIEALRESDVAFLCLPDAASLEICDLVKDVDTIIIDTSTAHRVSDGWTYGFAEIGNAREEIKNSKRIANPGCHASGFIALVAPLIEKNILSKDALLSAFSITGYTGGGKKMISDYEDSCEKSFSIFKENNVDVSFLEAPRQYGISQMHKHLPEMKKICGLNYEPVFSPVVAHYPCGMEVTVPIHKSQINGSILDIKNVYKKYYNGPIVKYVEEADELGFISANKLSGYDDMEISVVGNGDRMLLISRFDNLGKGASGAAIQNMNIALGTNETEGLSILLK